MMTLRLLIAGGLFWLAAQSALAQSADEFFNSGAQFYISNNIPDALKKVEAGRQIYPDNIKLKKLEELLKQQQQQQQQQNQQNQQNQSQKNQNSKNQQSQSRQNQQQQQNQAQKQQNAQKQLQNSQQQHNAEKEKAGQKSQPAQAMTAEEAKRLLDSQKGNEQVLPFKPQNQPENSTPPLKDW